LKSGGVLHSFYPDSYYLNHKGAEIFDNKPCTDEMSVYKHVEPKKSKKNEDDDEDDEKKDAKDDDDDDDDE
jgi:hypothetical protein